MVGNYRLLEKDDSIGNTLGITADQQVVDPSPTVKRGAIG